MQVLILGRATRTKETLPDFLKWRRVTRPPLVFRRLTGSQRTHGFWGVTEEQKGEKKRNRRRRRRRGREEVQARKRYGTWDFSMELTLDHMEFV